MNAQRMLLAITLAVSSVAPPAALSAQAPDNTKINKSDRDAGQPTADQQKENRSDREMAKKIRQSIMADKSLSSYAHNVKIISQNGTVTLKGPVKSEDEKTSVMSKAVAVAGSADKVTDQITVKH
jgi:hyperosmotically inducible protein